MEEELRYSLRRSEYVLDVHAIVRSIGGTRLLRNQRIAYLYYAILFVGFTVVAIYFPYGRRSLCLFALVLLLAQMLVILLTGKYEAGASWEPARHKDVTAAFDRDGVRYVGQHHHQSWEWPLFRKLHSGRGVFILEFAGYDMVVVPKRAFSSEAHAQN